MGQHRILQADLSTAAVKLHLRHQTVAGLRHWASHTHTYTLSIEDCLDLFNPGLISLLLTCYNRKKSSLILMLNSSADVKTQVLLPHGHLYALLSLPLPLSDPPRRPPLKAPEAVLHSAVGFITADSFYGHYYTVNSTRTLIGCCQKSEQHRIFISYWEGRGRGGGILD